MKKLCLILLICLVFPFCFSGCAKQSQINQYLISVEFCEDEKKLNCKQTVIYVNNSENVLNEIPFFVYANAFSQGQKPVSLAYEKKAYPNGVDYGNCEVFNVAVDGAVAQFNVDINILTVSLSQDLFPEESVEIFMEFTVNLANINHRLGYGVNTINCGNFFPIACVYEDGVGFVKNEYSTNGDPFYSDIANFQVDISCPEKYAVATTGEKTELVENGERKVNCKATKVRDFCFVMSESFKVVSEVFDDTRVSYFYVQDEKNNEHLKLMGDALLSFEKMFGDYPYKQLSVVQADFCFGGMEYPNLVYVSSSINDEELFNYVTVHEIAHQWWYGLVGNNQFAESWIDEGLTEFSVALFFENHPEYGIEYDKIVSGAKTAYQSFTKVFDKVFGKVDESMNRSLNEFSVEPEYVNIAYTKGMLLFCSLRETMRDQKFFGTIKKYFDENKYQNVSAEKLIDSFSRNSGVNLEGFFKAWITGTVKLNLI